MKLYALFFVINENYFKPLQRGVCKKQIYPNA